MKEVIEMKMKVVWEEVPDGKHYKDVIPEGFLRVKNDRWLRKALGLWDKGSREYTFFWNPETGETLVWFVMFVGGSRGWLARLGRVIKNEREFKTYLWAKLGTLDKTEHGAENLAGELKNLLSDVKVHRMDDGLFIIEISPVETIQFRPRTKALEQALSVFC
ncbi:MAG: hypothetical protein H0Z19_07420 [Archaeoglobus sp.]|uniref:hypothetical protein n=1 Tax=Archaeoglobus sp. TaxID=1872626 RepID=UPI001DAA6119|nr:hypothetical protein [Archaeoglobus sp.]MBO8180294.1 hypothetical protein [Archaeoglobus sp.]